MALNPVRAVMLSSADDVAATLDEVPPSADVAVSLISSGETIRQVRALSRIPFGHKIAIRQIESGRPIVRYGYPIGIATAPINEGEHVHSHNMRSRLSPPSNREAGESAIRPAQWVRQTVMETLRAVGAHADGALAMADALTEAHLRGVETHGLRRLRPYISRIRSGGGIDPAARPEITQHRSVLKIDGRNGIGHYVATCAAHAVSEAARQHGIAIALVTNSNHFGFAGYYATLMAQKHQFGLVTSNGQVCVAPAGATKSLLSNNPFAIAAPTGRSDTFLELDLATSVTSRANVLAAGKTGALLPKGWAQDSEGRPTREPKAALEGSLLSFGGEKGFALLFALEAMTGVLSGGAYADQVSSKEAAPDAPEGTVHTMIAIDLDSATGAAAFSSRLDDLIHRLLGLPKNSDANPIRYPGQRRWMLRQKRLREGVPVSEAELNDVLDLAKELGVSPPRFEP